MAAITERHIRHPIAIEVTDANPAGTFTAGVETPRRPELAAVLPLSTLLALARAAGGALAAVPFAEVCRVLALQGH